MADGSLNRQDYIDIFENEFLIYANDLKTFGFHLTFDEVRAEDLVQETYMKAFRFINKYESGTNPKAWLFRIMKNEFINLYRKKSREPAKIDIDEVINISEESDDQYLAGYVDLGKEIFSSMIGDEISAALNNLHIDFRTVILLCDVEDFKYDEISKIIGIPIGTVRSRLHRGRKLLKQSLKEYAVKRGFS